MRDKRKAFEAILEKFEKILPHLGNENDGEARAATFGEGDQGGAFVLDLTERKGAEENQLRHHQAL